MFRRGFMFLQNYFKDCHNGALGLLYGMVLFQYPKISPMTNTVVVNNSLLVPDEVATS